MVYGGFMVVHRGFMVVNESFMVVYGSFMVVFRGVMGFLGSYGRFVDLWRFNGDVMRG